MVLLQKIKNPFVKGILVSVPLALLTVLIASLVASDKTRVWNVLLLSCYPTTGFCLPVDKALTMMLLLLIALGCSLYFVKTLRERILFVLGFGLLFWIFQSASAVVAYIMLLVIGYVA